MPSRQTNNAGFRRRHAFDSNLSSSDRHSLRASVRRQAWARLRRSTSIGSAAGVGSATARAAGPGIGGRYRQCGCGGGRVEQGRFRWHGAASAQAAGQGAAAGTRHGRGTSGGAGQQRWYRHGTGVWLRALAVVACALQIVRLFVDRFVYHQIGHIENEIAAMIAALKRERSDKSH
jgi:hypothetical protein